VLKRRENKVILPVLLARDFLILGGCMENIDKKLIDLTFRETRRIASSTGFIVKVSVNKRTTINNYYFRYLKGKYISIGHSEYELLKEDWFYYVHDYELVTGNKWKVTIASKGEVVTFDVEVIGEKAELIKSSIDLVFFGGGRASKEKKKGAPRRVQMEVKENAKEKIEEERKEKKDNRIKGLDGKYHSASLGPPIRINPTHNSCMNAFSRGMRKHMREEMEKREEKAKKEKAKKKIWNEFRNLLLYLLFVALLFAILVK
jgi:hypothetical protein